MTPKFIIVDHSLERLGGHHYSYAVTVLEAAEAAGYQPVLACNRRFSRPAKLPKTWRTYSLFRYDTYTKCSLTDPRAFSQPLNAESDSSWLARCRETWHDWRRQSRIRNFGQSCRNLFAREPLSAGDQVFIPTLSELDLLGLANCLSEYPASSHVDWHLQFHFPILNGREPEYELQSQRLAEIRARFADALEKVPNHRLHFYTTSQQLCDQYNLMDLATFRELPYQVNKAFHQETVPPAQDHALRLTSVGALREEKGFASLANLARDLASDLVPAQKIQFVVQSNRRDFRLSIPELPVVAAATAPRPSLSRAREPVVYVPFPLDPQGSEYLDLIRQADIGLFLYDSRRYYGRCSSVLVEMLSAGVPVIVPAGCWLAEQIAEPNFRHLEGLLQNMPVVQSLVGRNIAWQNSDVDAPRAKMPGQLAFADATAATQGVISIPTDATDLLATFDWFRPTRPGAYVRLDAQQCDAEGRLLKRSSVIVGHRVGNKAIQTMVPLASGAASVRLSWSNAYDDAFVTIRNVNFTFFDANATASGHCPIGAIGLAAAEPKQVGDLVRDITAHYAHYRQSAAAFAREWAPQHAPNRTIAELLARSRRATAVVPQLRVA